MPILRAWCWLRHVSAAGLFASVLLLPSCRPSAVGGVETVITLHSIAAAAGVDVRPSEACVWIVGRGGTGVGMSLVLAHGGISVEECLLLGPP